MADDLQTSEESAFVVEEVTGIVTQSINFVLGKEDNYNELKVPQWVESVLEHTIHGLTNLKKPFKYVANCIIMQNNGAGIHSANSYWWNTVSDDTVTVRWPNDKNKDRNRTMYAIVTVYGVGL